MMQTKRIFSLLLVVFLVFPLAGCSGGEQEQVSNGSAGSEDSAKVVNLKLASMFGPTHAVQTRILEPWAKEIEAATEGRVKVTIYPVDTLLKANDIYEGVLSKIADIGVCDPGYNVGRFPLLSSFFLGGLEYANSKVASYVAWDMVMNMNLKETQDTKFMFVYGLQPGAIMSKDPIKTLEDFKGKQIRVTGFATESVKALGGTPVGMPMPEVYEALLKGTIDANLAPSEVLKGWKQAEVVQYITKAPFINTVFHYITMNLDTWNSLSLEDQKAIEAVNKKIFEQSSTLFGDFCDEGEEFAVQEHGNEIITISDQEKQRWLEALAPVQDKWVKDMESKGLDGKSVLEAIKKSTAKYNELYGK